MDGIESSPSVTHEHPLHICPRCKSELVHALDWCEAGGGKWKILLRCPECELQREDVFDQPAVERFDDEQDRFSGACIQELERTTNANRNAEIDFFVQALETELITPDDF